MRHNQGADNASIKEKFWDFVAQQWIEGKIMPGKYGRPEDWQRLVRDNSDSTLFTISPSPAT